MRNIGLLALVSLSVIGLGQIELPAARAASPGYGFELDVTLSPKAAAKLAALGEKIIVSAEWMGDPAKGAPKKELADGQIPLGEVKVQIPGTGGHAVVSDTKFQAAKLKWVKGPVQVLINVFTARLKDENNLIACDIFQDDVAKLQSTPTTLTCKLIYGES